MSLRIHSSWPISSLDVLGHRPAQPGQPLRQAAAEGHQERCRVTHVVIGLAEKGEVARQADPALQALGDHRCRQQLRAIGCGCGDQLFMKRHGGLPHPDKVQPVRRHGD
jgi:hypothetical protein